MNSLQKKAEERYPGKIKKAGSHGVIAKKQREAYIAGYLAGQQKTGGWISVDSLRRMIEDMERKQFREEVIVDEVLKYLREPELLHRIFPPPTGEPGEPVDLSNTNWMTDENKKTFLKSIQGEDQEGLWDEIMDIVDEVKFMDWKTRLNKLKSKFIIHRKE